MANEIQFGTQSGLALEYRAFKPDGTDRVALTPLPEVGSTGYYTVSDGVVQVGDQINVYEIGFVDPIGQGLYELPDVAQAVLTLGLATTVQLNNYLASGGTVTTLLDAIKVKTEGLNFTGTDVKATLDGETVETSNPTDVSGVPAATVTAILAATGVTVGDDWSIAKCMKIINAMLVGKWEDSGTAGTYNVLDPDDSTTVVLTVTPAVATPYRTFGVQI